MVFSFSTSVAFISNRGDHAAAREDELRDAARRAPDELRAARGRGGPRGGRGRPRLRRPPGLPGRRLKPPRAGSAALRWDLLLNHHPWLIFGEAYVSFCSTCDGRIGFFSRRILCPSSSISLIVSMVDHRIFQWLRVREGSFANVAAAATE